MSAGRCVESSWACRTVGLLPSAIRRWLQRSRSFVRAVRAPTRCRASAQPSKFNLVLSVLTLNPRHGSSGRVCCGLGDLVVLLVL